MRLPFPGERNIRGPLDLLRRVWRDTLDQPDPGDLAEALKRARSRAVRRLRPRRRARSSARAGGRVDADRHLGRDAGSTATAACGVSTRATGSPASGRRRARSTPGPARSASRGTTRSGSPASRGGRRRPTGASSLEARIAIARGGADRGQPGGRRAGGGARAPGDRAGGDGRNGGRRRYRDAARLELRKGETRLAGLRSRRWNSRPPSPRSRRLAERRRYLGDPRSHLSHAAVPEAPDKTNRRAFAETWAAVTSVCSWSRSRSSCGSGCFVRADPLSWSVIGTWRSSRSSSAASMHLLRITLGLAVIAATPRVPVPAGGAARRTPCPRRPAHR